MKSHELPIGPLSASVAASDWGLYFGGVFDDCPYDQNIAVNHAGNYTKNNNLKKKPKSFSVGFETPFI